MVVNTMKTAKHRTKSREILESAFQTWGRSFFRDRSLAELAAAQGMTKQALYRYFPSKEKLEEAMEETAAEHYSRHAEALYTRLSLLHNDCFAKSYITENIAYMRGNRHYMGFLAYRHRHKHSAPGGETCRSAAEHFTTLGRENAGIPAVGMRYLNAVIFMDIYRGSSAGTGASFSSNAGTGADSRSNSSSSSSAGSNSNFSSGSNSGLQRKAEYSEDWHEAWRSGFASPLLTAQPDFPRLLAGASNLNYDAFGSDPLIRAVFETVMEEAGSRVSLEKIAAKAGLTKSSLYNYWPSKQAMLSDVLDRQISVFSRLFHEFSKPYVNPADRLFSYLIFTAGFFRRTPEILNYIQRIMSFGIAVPLSAGETDGEFIRPLSDILNTGLLNLHTYNPADFPALVNLAAVNEIKHHLAEGSAGIHIDQCLKDLYLLITGGLNTIRRTIL